MKRRAGQGAGWLLPGLWLCACDADAKPMAPPPPTAASVAVPKNLEPPPAAAAIEPRRLRFRSVGAPALTATNVEGVGELLTVGAVPALIDLEDGTRLNAAPHTQLCAFRFAKTLLLVSGQAHVTRLPDSERAGAVPARVASLAGALETSPGTDLELRVATDLHADGIAYRAQLGLLRGAVTWFGFDERGAREPSQLSLDSPSPKPADGLQWSTGASQATREQHFQALRRVVLRSQELDHALDAALLEQQALRERGHALLARVSPRHAALAKSSAQNAAAEASPREYQRALVEHARLRQAQSEQLLLAAERSLLGALAACGARSTDACASLAAWSERFSARVASLL